ncbi:DUF3099 domain-containing protein [Streptacidiphilus sp. MAP5-3]|uniref:DUF3099 domain-containing protein n=1 Tax=unclassified Streptacidiphilus TaxID=2643834 RepID=UPI003518BEE6
MHFPLHRHPVVRITDARPSVTDDIRHRQRRYALTMGIRTLCVILAVVLWQESRIAAIIALVCGGVLPYIAVVYANAGRETTVDPPEAYIPPQAGPPPQPGSEPKPEQAGPDPDDPSDAPGDGF